MNDEWRTPIAELNLVHRVLERIETDPCSTLLANQVVNAKQFYTKEMNSLNKTWTGPVFLNPPYSRELIKLFADKMTQEHLTRGVEGIMLVNASTDTEWFHKLMNVASAVCFNKGRIAFEGESGTKRGNPRGQAYFLFGRTYLEKFKLEFMNRGKVVLL